MAEAYERYTNGKVHIYAPYWKMSHKGRDQSDLKEKKINTLLKGLE